VRPILVIVLYVEYVPVIHEGSDLYRSSVPVNGCF